MFYSFPLIVTLSLLPLSLAHKVTLCEHKDFGGKCHEIDLNPGVCHEVPQELNDQVSSVNTHGKCVTLYEHSGCQGTSHVLRPGSVAHDDLDNSQVDFNDKASSMKLCDKITLCEDAHFQGNCRDYEVGQDCLDVEQDMNDKASSVNTH